VTFTVHTCSNGRRLFYLDVWYNEQEAQLLLWTCDSRLYHSIYNCFNYICCDCTAYNARQTIKPVSGTSLQTVATHVRSLCTQTESTQAWLTKVYGQWT